MHFTSDSVKFCNQETNQTRDETCKTNNTCVNKVSWIDRGNRVFQHLVLCHELVFMGYPCTLNVC